LVTSVTITPLPIAQGNTIVVRLTTKQPMDLTGSLDGSDLHFFPGMLQTATWALQGIYAMADTGLTTLCAKGQPGNHTLFNL